MTLNFFSQTKFKMYIKNINSMKNLVKNLTTALL